MIKAIETQYKGYRFRSRLEARWAVFFDALGLTWEYEPEGFELGDGVRYLPDFRVRGTLRSKFVEVKPLVRFELRERQKLELFAREVILHRPEYFAVVRGDPLDARMWLNGRLVQMRAPAEPGEFPYVSALLEGNECLHMWSLFAAGSCGHTVLDAAKAARGARFEFGESGAQG